LYAGNIRDLFGYDEDLISQVFQHAGNLSLTNNSDAYCFLMIGIFCFVVVVLVVFLGCGGIRVGGCGTRKINVFIEQL
jgi:hypothetical protein